MTPAPRTENVPSSQRGFTVLKLAVVVTIVAILAALAIPYYKHTKQSSQIGSLQHDLRQYQQAFDSFALNHGKYPPSQITPGASYPHEMSDRLSPAWKRASPIGGKYRWVYSTENDPQQRTGYIEIVNTAESPILLDTDGLIEIDQNIDDGNITSGNLRLVGINIRYVIK